MIEEDFGKPASEIFKHIEDKPMGAASLAQVHRCILHDGTTVAVKVQHRNVKAFSDTDVKCMEVSNKLLYTSYLCCVSNEKLGKL